MGTIGRRNIRRRGEKDKRENGMNMIKVDSMQV
jgi:hypothetical protein